VSDEWYGSGLRFTCQRCGACCTGAPGAVWVEEADILAIAALLGRSVTEVEIELVRRHGLRRRLYEWPNGDCVFYERDGKSCRVHAARPRQCRAWPFWAENLASAASWERARTACPGCGTGELFAAEEIRRRRWP
jgi:hypothetical protein